MILCRSCIKCLYDSFRLHKWHIFVQRCYIPFPIFAAYLCLEDVFNKNAMKYDVTFLMGNLLSVNYNSHIINIWYAFFMKINFVDMSSLRDVERNN